MQHAITILEVLGVLAVLFLAGAVATRGGPVLVDSGPDDPELELPVGPLQPEDVRRVRFGMVVRGYRMREVDQVLARVAAELAARDARLLALEQALVEVVEPSVDDAVAQAEPHLAAAGELLSPESLPPSTRPDNLLTAEQVAAPASPEPSPAPGPDTLQPEPPVGPEPPNAEDPAPEPQRAPVAQPWFTPPSPPVRWPQPDLEPEPEALALPMSDEREPAPEPVREPLAGPRTVDDSAFSAALSELDDDAFPEVQRADDDPEPHR